MQKESQSELPVGNYSRHFILPTLSHFILTFSLLNIFALVFKLDPQMILVLQILNYWKIHSQEKALKSVHISEHKMQKSNCYDFFFLPLKQKFAIMTKIA